MKKYEICFDAFGYVDWRIVFASNKLEAETSCIRELVASGAVESEIIIIKTSEKEG